MEALETVACEQGVQIYTSAEVKRIRRVGKQVNGVQVNGETVDANYVLCGADAVVAYHALIDGHQYQREKVNQLEPSLSGMVFLWGVKGKHPRLAHHNIIFSSDYNTEFRQIFRDKQVPDDPTIYIAITSSLSHLN